MMRTLRRQAVSVASGAVSFARRFRDDRRGGTAVQAIVMLPAIIIAFWGLMLVWRVVQIRDTLHHGVYQATRFLSLYPPEPASDGSWSEVADKIVAMEMSNNPYVVRDGKPLLSSDYSVEVTLLDGADIDCKSKFEVTAWYRIFDIPTGEPTVNAGLPGLRDIRLDEVRQGEILCQ
jgi:hypothetical protein